VQPVAVIGAGSWGTALACLLGSQGVPVRLWSRRPEQLDEISRLRENRRYLPGVLLPECIHPEAELTRAVRDCFCVLLVVPSHVLREVFCRILPALRPGALLISATKGIENDSLQTMTQVMAGELHAQSLTGHPLVVLSGPSFAREVAAGLPAAVTVASLDQAAAITAQQLFATSWFRVYTSSDVIGLEISAALKNVIAIAAGISDGLGFGTNARAALITRGLAEITRLGLCLGADARTFAGLGGLGDLVLTCTGDLSRNRTLGLKLGAGLSLQDALAEMTMVAEGVKSTKSGFQLAERLGVEMPILNQVHRILYDGIAPAEAVRELLTRELKEEVS